MLEGAAGRKRWPGALLIVTGALLPLTAVVFHRLGDALEHQTAHGFTVYPVVLLVAGLVGVHAQLRPGRVAAVGLAVAVLGFAAVVAGALTAATWGPAPVGEWAAHHPSLFVGVDTIRPTYELLSEAMATMERGDPRWQAVAGVAAEWPGWLVSIGGVAVWATGALSSRAVRRAGGLLVLAGVPVGIAVLLLAGDRVYAAAWADVALAVTLGLGLAAVGRGALLEELAPRRDWRLLAVAGGAALALAGFALGLPAGQRFGPLHRHPVHPPGEAAFELVALCRPAAPGDVAHARGRGSAQKVVEAKVRFASAWPEGTFHGSLPALGFAWEPEAPQLAMDHRGSGLAPARSPRLGVPGDARLVRGAGRDGLADAAALRWGAEKRRAGLGVLTGVTPHPTVREGRATVVLMRPAEGPEAPPPPPLERVRLTVGFFDVDGWRTERSADLTC